MRLQYTRQLLAASALMSAAFLAGCESKEEKAIKFTESGAAYMAEGDVDGATIQYNNALFNDPENVDALRGAAKMAELQQDFPRQISMLQRLLALVPDDLNANISFSELSMRAGEPQRARDHAERVLEQDPENVKALNLVGASLVMENRLEEATEILERAASLDPDSPDVFNLMAAKSLRGEQVDDAIAILEEGIRESTDPETLLVVRLVVAERFEDEDKVVETFERLLETAPEVGIYYERFADFLVSKGREVNRARTLYEQAVPLLEDPARAYLRIVALERLENGDAAGETLLRRYADENPELMDLQFAIPAYFCEQRDFEECEQAFTRILSRDDLSEEATMRAMNGETLAIFAQGDFARAETKNAAVLEIDEANALGLVTQARFQLIEGQNDAAITTLRSALDSDPDSAEGLVFLAIAYEASGQTRFADAQFARAVDQVGYQKNVVDQYRNFLLRQGETSRAQELMARYTRNNPSDANAAREAAQLSLATGDATDAEARARQILSFDEDDIDAKAILANALTAQREFEDALPLVRDVVNARPDSEPGLTLYATLLREVGRKQELTTLLNERLQRENVAAFDYAILADFHRAEGKTAEAIAVAEQSRDKFPSAERVYVTSYLSLLEGNRRSDAIEVLQRGVRLANQTVEIRGLLSNELILDRKFDEALGILESLEKDAQLTPLTANNLASLLLDFRDQPARALALAERLPADQNPYFADTKAWALYQNDRAGEALTLAQRAAAAEPENADIQYHYGLIAAANGDLASARQALERAMKYAPEQSPQTPLSDIEEALAAL